MLLADYVFSLVLFALPVAVVAGIGWWLSTELQNVWVRLAVRAGLIAVVFAPTPSGQMGFAPAIFALFLPTVRGTPPWPAVGSLFAVWLVAFVLMVWIERSWRSRRPGRKVKVPR